MINRKVEEFLENNNMNFLFCLLSNLEVKRLNDLPPHVKNKFDGKITEMAIDHVAQNDVPEYFVEEEEEEVVSMRDYDMDEDDEDDFPEVAEVSYNMDDFDDEDDED